MSALGVPVLINPNKSYWLSSIGTDVIHSTIVTDTIDANLGNISTLNSDFINASTLNVSSLNAAAFDVSGMYVSSIRGNTAFFSTMTLASDLSGGVGYVRFSVDASGIQVDGDPIRFDNLVYLTSSINIVQVSTIVDTDIFAQRGFFSTLSSGIADIQQGLFSSIICYDISGQNGSFDRLFVSSLEALDISGVSASNWSLFPTLNSTITFQPGYVLSNIGPSLYFAGVELTDVSGGGQDWARFPAVSTVNMNNNSMGGLSTLTYQDGGRLYSLTGNNLFYNGQQISYGPGGATSNWAQYPANNNVNINGSNLSNAALIAGSNLTLSGSNITNGNTFTNSLGVGGLSALPIASITSGGDISCRNLDVGDSTTSLADVAVYGVNALPGDNALYVIGGTTLTGGLTAGVPVHGTEIGALPVAGVDTVRIDVLPAGMGLNSATYIQLAALGAGSFAAGGALSLAGGDYVEVNTDDFRVINTTSGNQSTTLTVANIQMPASVAASVPLQINNTAGGGINLVGSAGVGQIANFSSIAGNSLIGSTSVQSPLVSTININLSTINGIDWQDISGGVFTTVSSFNTLTTSSFLVSSIGVQSGGFPVEMIGGLRMGPVPYAIQNCLGINTDQSLNVSIFANEFGVAAFNTNIGSLSSTKIRSSNVLVSSLQGFGGVVDVSGGMSLTAPLFLPLSNAVQFDDGSLVTFSQFQYRDVANNSMVALTDTNGLAPVLGSNMRPLGVGELWLTGATDQYQACRLYSQFPYGNYELDAVDEDGAFLFAYMQGFENGSGVNPGFCQAYSNVSSISGYNQQSAANPVLSVIGSISTGNLSISSINGFPIDGGSFDNNFSTINTSSLAFSTLYSSTATASFYYPIFIDHDAQNGPTSGAAIAVRGHNSNTGAVIHQIEMGWRASDGANYIQAVWPGQNLEDLTLEGDPVKITDGSLSTIFNQNPYAMQTTQGVAVGLGSGLITLSTNLLKVGGQTNLTGTSISTTFLQTAYGNNLYFAGQQQPCIFNGTVTLPGGGGVTSSLITLPTAYTTKDFDVQLTYKDQYDNSGLHWSTQTSGSFLAYGGSSKILSWASFGNLPFTG